MMLTVIHVYTCCVLIGMISERANLKVCSVCILLCVQVVVFILPKANITSNYCDFVTVDAR